MINLGLSYPQLLDLFGLCWSPHAIKVDICITDMNGNGLQWVGHLLEEGQVDFHMDDDVTRSTEFTLLDPGANVIVNPRNPLQGGLYLNRMVKVWYSVGPLDQSYWYTIPVFTGPITGVGRDDLTVNISAAGKDSLMYASFPQNKEFTKGTPINHIVQWIFDVMGENRGLWSQPLSTAKLARDTTISRAETIPWGALKKYYNQMGAEIFYDGNGVLQWRQYAGAVVAGFADNQISTRPAFTFDTENLANAVLVIGGDPKGEAGRPRAYFEAPPSHPLSPQSMGRNGQGRYYTKVVSDDTILKQGDADDRAYAELIKSLIMSVNAEWEGPPFPMLEEYDQYQLITDDVNATFRFKESSIPLTADGSMTMGFTQKVSKPIRKRKHKKRGGKGKGGKGKPKHPTKPHKPHHH